MLLNRLPEIEIPEGNPFENDKLDRKTCAIFFINLIKQYYNTGCVIALNGEWGSGKTTFVKMVQQELKNIGAHPLYFNAWENDYVSDPLIAILSELKEVCPKSDKWDAVIANGSKIALRMGAAAFIGFIKNNTGISVDAISAGTKEAVKILKNNIDKFKEQKQTFQEFHKSLRNYIADKSSSDTPVVFFIDELDRCNPQFAVLVLERIKHLFDIPNIVFVLSINKKQLGYAIQGYYGSANIDANNYLRRFIDIEYTLPRQNIRNFYLLLYEKYGFEKLFEDSKQVKFSGMPIDLIFGVVSNTLLSSSKIDFRTADKIYAHARLAMNEFFKHKFFMPDVFFLLSYLRIVYPELYQNIINEKYSLQALVDEIEEKLPLKVIKKEHGELMSTITLTIASLVFTYIIGEDGLAKESFINKNDCNAITLTTKYLCHETFTNIILNLYEKASQGFVQLKQITKRIELEEDVLLE